MSTSWQDLMEMVEHKNKTNEVKDNSMSIEDIMSFANIC